MELVRDEFITTTYDSSAYLVGTELSFGGTTWRITRVLPADPGQFDMSVRPYLVYGRRI